MIVSKIASAAFNTITGGLLGFESTQNISIELIEDEIVETRLGILQKYILAGKLPLKDLYYSINCIQLDCASLDKCCEHDPDDDLFAHFEIPQILINAGEDAIGWAGSTDKQIKFKVYTSPSFRFHKYKMRGSKKPFIYIDPTPNKNNLYDGYVFNAPMLEQISITAIFKDPRQLELDKFSCCTDELEKDNMSPLTTEIKDTLIKKYVTYYRQYQQPPVQNDQEPR